MCNGSNSSSPNLDHENEKYGLKFIVLKSLVVPTVNGEEARGW